MVTVEQALVAARERFGQKPTLSDVWYENKTEKCAVCLLSEVKHIKRHNRRFCLLVGLQVGLRKGGCDAFVD